MRRPRTIALRRCSILLLLAGCGAAPSGNGPANDPNLYIASESSFEPFRTWEPFSFDSPGSSDGFVHTAGHRTVYLNKRPPHGSAAFPVGTIIVKVLDAAPGNAFAMVKRGGDYNSSGATGWEWFDLDLSLAVPAIVWRGVAPPSGMSYSGNGGPDCNTCHASATANDFVQATPLQLGNL